LFLGNHLVSAHPRTPVTWYNVTDVVSIQKWQILSLDKAAQGFFNSSAMSRMGAREERGIEAKDAIYAWTLVNNIPHLPKFGKKLPVIGG
jgi:hypothetical protein